jgi:predicted transcriptional regulator
MNTSTRTIEVDVRTAELLEARAAEEGVSVSEFVAGLTALATSPVALSSDELAELDRRWAAIKAGEPTVPHEEVARWLETWGTPEFKRWHER